MPFVFERPNMTDIGLSQISKSLESPPSERLQYIEESYLINQVSDGLQLTVCERLDIPHGHLTNVSGYRQLCNSSKTKVTNVMESSVLEKSEESTKFVQFITLKEEMEVAKWKSCFAVVASELFSSFIKKQGKNSANDQNVESRQILHADYGICSNRNTGRKDVDSPVLGCTRPRLLQGTAGNKHIFDNFTKLLRKHCDWIWKMNDERLKVGARQISKNNDIEAIRVAINLIWLEDWESLNSYQCGLHIDKFNDVSYPRVAVLSGMTSIIPNKLIARVSIIAYTRQSIGDFLARVRTEGKAVESISRLY